MLVVHTFANVYPHAYLGGFEIPERPQGVGLPAFTLDKEPPFIEGFWPCLDSESAEVVQLEDHRGQAGYVNGEPVTIAELGPLPEGFSDTPPPVTDADVEKARAEALETLKTYRQSVELGGFMFMGVRWDSAEKDEMRLANKATQMERRGEAVFKGWKVQDGVYLDVTLEELLAAGDAMEAHIESSFAVERAKIAEIEAIAASEDENGAKLEKLTAWLENELKEGWPGHEEEAA